MAYNIFTQTIEQTIVRVFVRRFLAFFLFLFYYVVCKQVERLPLLVIKTMTLKSQTNIQINRQQDARRRKKFVRARLISLGGGGGGNVLKGLVTWRNFSPGWDFSPAVDVLKGV